METEQSSAQLDAVSRGVDGTGEGLRDGDRGDRAAAGLQGLEVTGRAGGDGAVVVGELGIAAHVGAGNDQSCPAESVGNVRAGQAGSLGLEGEQRRLGGLRGAHVRDGGKGAGARDRGLAVDGGDAREEGEGDLHVCGGRVIKRD